MGIIPLWRNKVAVLSGSFTHTGPRGAANTSWPAALCFHTDFTPFLQQMQGATQKFGHNCKAPVRSSRTGAVSCRAQMMLRARVMTIQRMATHLVI